MSVGRLKGVASQAASFKPNPEMEKIRQGGRQLIKDHPKLQTLKDAFTKARGEAKNKAKAALHAEVAKAVDKSPYWKKQSPAARKEAVAKYAFAITTEDLRSQPGKMDRDLALAFVRAIGGK